MNKETLKMDEVLYRDFNVRECSGGVEYVYINHLDIDGIRFEQDIESASCKVISNGDESVAIAKLYFDMSRVKSNDFSKLKTNHIVLVDNNGNEWTLNNPNIRVIFQTGKEYIDFNGVIVRYTTKDYEFYKKYNVKGRTE